MIYKVNVNSEIKINNLEDLHKLKVIMEANNLKVNKSQIAIKLGVDARTVGKYLNGYVKKSTRKRKSAIDNFRPIIKSLLSKDSIQVFYYKRVLWQYLKDNYGLDCVQSSFRRYISNNPEFDEYFKRRKKGYISNFDELHGLVETLNNRINSTCHTATGKIPVLHLEKEKDFLLELPTQQIRNHYNIITTSVKVNRQSMISYKSNHLCVLYMQLLSLY